MQNNRRRWGAQLPWVWALRMGMWMVPDLAMAQASPFETGATNLVTTVIAIATPLAILLVMALGVAAAAGQIAWSWAIGVLVGIGLLFGATPVVTWARGLFGV
jgi:type IV secretory pathway VirB2 component (pilin)